MINQQTDSGAAGKQLMGMLIGIVVVAGLGFGAQQLFMKPRLDRVMMEAASEMNKACPIMVDAHTRLNNTVALPGRVYQFNYTLVSLTRDDINVDSLAKFIEPGVINAARTSPDLKGFRDNDITLAYHYRDRYGTFVHKFTVSPEQYAAD